MFVCVKSLETATPKVAEDFMTLQVFPPPQETHIQFILRLYKIFLTMACYLVSIQSETFLKHSSECQTVFLGVFFRPKSFQ